MTERKTYKAITGETYHIKDHLQAKFGAKWDATKKAWKVEKTLADEAQSLVDELQPLMKVMAEAKRNFGRPVDKYLAQQIVETRAAIEQIAPDATITKNGETINRVTYYGGVVAAAETAMALFTKHQAILN